MTASNFARIHTLCRFEPVAIPRAAKGQGHRVVLASTGEAIGTVWQRPVSRLRMLLGRTPIAGGVWRNDHSHERFDTREAAVLGLLDEAGVRL